MIDAELYRKIVGNMPICCVDLVVHFFGRCLFVLRVNEPAKGQWWLPGGRLLKGEDFKEAALRIAKQELGIEVMYERVVGVYNYLFDRSMFPGISAHSVNVAVLVTSSNLTSDAIRLDVQHSQWCLTSCVPEGSHAYVREVVLDSGVM